MCGDCSLTVAERAAHFWGKVLDFFRRDLGCEMRDGATRRLLVHCLLPTAYCPLLFRSQASAGQIPPRGPLSRTEQADAPRQLALAAERKERGRVEAEEAAAQ
jgi:hypothetical protein